MPNESRDASRSDPPIPRGEIDDVLIPSGFFFAAARDVLLDQFSDARVDGLKLRRSRAEIISADICDLAIRRFHASTSSDESEPS
jgi:hypothetical protein